MEAAKQEVFSRLCKRFNWKCTPQRLAVYACVADNRMHPDVDTVWHAVKSKLPTVTRESVYRILNEFAGHGLIWRLDHVTSARYDSNTAPHGHFICENCGDIVDFALSGSPENFAGSAVPGVVKHMEIRFTGLCPECHKQHAEKTAK